MVKKAFLTVVAALMLPTSGLAADVVLSGDEVFGGSGGYFHPFVAVAQVYDDNIYNASYKVDDFYTLVSPGIWIAAPGNRERILDINSSTVAPSGLQINRDHTDQYRRFQFYGLYQGDFSYYMDYGDQDTEDHRLEAYFQLNTRGGFSFDVLNEFKDSHDQPGTGDSTQIGDYQTNLANARFVIPAGSKLRIKLDLANYMLDYDDAVNDIRDRTDNAYGAYLYFNLSPKFSLYTHYKYIDIDYDLPILSDSTEHQIYGGFKWDITAKSKGRIKVGYAMRDFELATMEDPGEVICEIDLDHHFTKKSSLGLMALRKLNETTIATTNYILTQRAGLRYSQHFTAKSLGSLAVSYTQDLFDGAITVGLETKEREDIIYTVSPTFTYAIQEWLSAEVAYAYTKRDSNFDLFDYDDNSAMLRITVSL